MVRRLLRLTVSPVYVSLDYVPLRLCVHEEVQSGLTKVVAFHKGHIQNPSLPGGY